MPGPFLAPPTLLGKKSWERGCAGLKNKGKEKTKQKKQNKQKGLGQMDPA